MKSNVKAVGAYLRRLREGKGMTTTQVGAALDTVEAQIRKIENGAVDTRGSMLINLCLLLEGDLGDIAQLMISEQATPERAIRLAENWIASREYQRQQGLRAVAEEQEEYTVKE
jgi:transcriptional regulator with XRE-family HTH domain